LRLFGIIFCQILDFVCHFEIAIATKISYRRNAVYVTRVKSQVADDGFSLHSDVFYGIVRLVTLAKARALQTKPYVLNG
jgi:hypothetical protein